MGILIERRAQKEWADASLAKKQLAWTKEARTKHPKLNFTKAIAKEENIIRSFVSGADGSSEAA